MGLSFGLIIISPSRIWNSSVWRDLTGGVPPPWMPMPEGKVDARGVPESDRIAMKAFIDKMDTIKSVRDRQDAYGGGRNSQTLLNDKDRANRNVYDAWQRAAGKKWRVIPTIESTLEAAGWTPLDRCRETDSYEVRGVMLATGRDANRRFDRCRHTRTRMC